MQIKAQQNKAMQNKSEQTIGLAGQGQSYFRRNDGVWNGLNRFGGKVRTGGVDDSSVVPQAYVDVPVGVSLRKMVMLVVLWMDVVVLIGAASFVVAGLFMLGYAVLSVTDVRHSELGAVAVVSVSWSYFMEGVVQVFRFVNALAVIFVVDPFRLDNLMPIATARAVSITVGETLRPSLVRFVGVYRVIVGLAVVTGVFVHLYVSSYVRLSWILQLGLFICAEYPGFQEAALVYGLALATLLLRPVAVVAMCFGLYVTRKHRRLRDKVSTSVRLQGGAKGDLVRQIASVTGLDCSQMFRFATVQEWAFFGTEGAPDDFMSKLRKIALSGDRELSSILTRVGLRNDWEVGHTSMMSQKLLTNAAFTRYFDVRLSGVFPKMRSYSEKRKGTLVEALAGIAALESGSNGQLERFVVHEIANVVGINLDHTK